MTISAFPTPTPSRSQAQDTFDSAVEAFLTHLPTFVSEANATAAAMSLNSTTDTSASSVAIGTGAKTFTVSASKSFLGGMYVVIADAAAPSTNLMVASITSYSGTTLVVDVKYVLGSGTKTSWIISQSAPAADIAAQIHGATDKTTPVGADEIGIWDSVSGLINRVSFTNLLNWFAAKAGNVAQAFSASNFTTAQGLTFPATQNPSADANTLDDYEEGTWTATLTASVAGPTTPVSVTGKYVKSGTKCLLNATFTNVDTTGASGDIQVTGAPFTAAGNSTADQYVGTAAINGLGTDPVVSSILGGQATIRIRSNLTTTYTPIVAGAAKYLFVTIEFITT